MHSIRLNVKHHKILKLIAERNIQYVKDRKGIPAVDFEIICKALNCNFEELNYYSAKLFSEEECQLYSVGGVEGLFCNPKGLTSYATKKYLKENTDAIIASVKNVLFISVALITIVSAIYTGVKAINSEAANKLKLERLEKEIDTLKRMQQSLNYK